MTDRFGSRDRRSLLMGWADQAQQIRRGEEAFFRRAPHVIAEMGNDEFRRSVGAVIGLAVGHGGFLGKSGYCFHGSVALRQDLFGGRGEHWMGYNAALYRGMGHYVGHVVAAFRGAGWDLDGQPKSKEEIRIWGDLRGAVAEDYAAEMRDLGCAWSEGEQADARIRRFRSDDRLLACVDWSDAEDLELLAHQAAIRSAMLDMRSQLAG